MAVVEQERIGHRMYFRLGGLEWATHQKAAEQEQNRNRTGTEQEHVIRWGGRGGKSGGWNEVRWQCMIVDISVLLGKRKMKRNRVGRTRQLVQVKVQWEEQNKNRTLITEKNE